MALSITKNTVARFFSLILVTGLSTAAFAASKEVIKGDIKESKETLVMAKAPEDQGFKSLDVDADGKISLQEAVKDNALAAKFNATDVNHDGAITPDEYALYTSTSKQPTAVN